MLHLPPEEQMLDFSAYNTSSANGRIGSVHFLEGPGAYQGAKQYLRHFLAGRGQNFEVETERGVQEIGLTLVPRHPVHARMVADVNDPGSVIMLPVVREHDVMVFPAADHELGLQEF